MAKTIASQMGLDIVIVKGQDIYSKYIGESEKKLGQLFKEAAKKNAILFFDEIHELFGNDSKESSGAGEKTCVPTDFLKLMDNKPKGLIIMAATNEPWKVKATVVRRFNMKYELKMPDTNARGALLKHFIREYGLLNFLKEDDIREYSEKLQDYSPNDIKNIIGEVHGISMDNIVEATYFLPWNLVDKNKAFIPCDSSDKGAIKTTYKQCPGMVRSLICRPYMNKALRECKKTEISEEHLEELRKFSKKHMR